MNEKLPAPCEGCGASGLRHGAVCSDCRGKGYRLIDNGRQTPLQPQSPQRWQRPRPAKLLRAFGEKVFEVIETQADRLREVSGIGPMRAARIVAAWAEQKAVREIMVFLHSHGVGTARAVRIFKTYGADAIQVMTENPYRLARDIRGIGFKTADAMAMMLGIEKTAMVRVRAGISYALTEAMDEGHCGLPTDELVPLAEKLLEVPKELVRTALDLELQEGTVIADRVGETPCVFLAGLHRAERTIAERLMRLANGKLPWSWIDPGKALPWVEQRIGLALADNGRRVRVACLRDGPRWIAHLQWPYFETPTK